MGIIIQFEEQYAPKVNVCNSKSLLLQTKQRLREKYEEFNCL